VDVKRFIMYMARWHLSTLVMMVPITTSGELKEVNRTYGWMLTGTFLNKSTEGVISYAERFNLPPSKTGIATFQIFPEERRIHVSC